MKKIIKKVINKIGYTIVNNKNKDTGSGYISAKKIIENAQKNGLSICDYIEKEWNESGKAQEVIDQLNNLKIFKNAKNICEIGAGTGIYLEKTLKVCDFISYESYEPAKDWANYLKQTYPIISYSANGINLNQTKNNSIDLILAHGVFVYLPFLTSYSYFTEMVRVIKKMAM